MVYDVMHNDTLEVISAHQNGPCRCALPWRASALARLRACVRAVSPRCYVVCLPSVPGKPNGCCLLMGGAQPASPCAHSGTALACLR